MLARALLLVLLAEIAAYALVGHWLVTRYGWSVPGVVCLALAVHVFARLGVVLFSFFMARRHDTGVGSRGFALLRAITTEWLVMLGPFGIGQVLYASAGTRTRRGAGRSPPVLLVHGYVCNAGIWTRAMAALRRAGFDVHAVSLEPVLGDIERQADRLARRIAELAPGPGDRVAVVAHSMGGLVLRACVRRHGVERIASLMTLGSPHRGTALAPLALGTCASQMVPGSDWIEGLWADRASLATIRVTTLRTLDDNLVVPPDTTLLPEARHLTIAGVSHTALPWSSRAIDAVITHLREAG